MPALWDALLDLTSASFRDAGGVDGPTRLLRSVVRMLGEAGLLFSGPELLSCGGTRSTCRTFPVRR